MDLLWLFCTPLQRLQTFILAAIIVGFSPFAAFAHMLRRIFHVPALMVIPVYVTQYGQLSIKIVTLTALAVYFLICIFLPVFVTIRTGWNWKIIDTRYHYHGVMDFHIVQKIQQILGPMVSIAELNWKGTYENTSLIEDVHVAVFGVPQSSGLLPDLQSRSLEAIEKRRDMDEITRANLQQLVERLRSPDRYVRRNATSLRVRLNIPNALALMHVGIEFLQLSAISTYHNGRPWLLSHSGNSISDNLLQPLNSFGITVLAFESSLLNIITFWIIVGAVGLWLWMTVPLHWVSASEFFAPGTNIQKMTRQKRRAGISGEEGEESSDSEGESSEINPEEDADEVWLRSEQQWLTAAETVTRTRLQRNVLFVLSDVMFFGIVIKLCGLLNCKYTVSPPTLIQGTWGTAYGVVAMLCLLYYVFTSFCYTNMQCEVRSEIVKDFDIQFDHQFTGLERLIKLVGASVMALFGVFPFVPQTVAALCAFCLTLLLSRQASCTAFFLDFWRPQVLYVVISSSLVSSIVILTESDEEPYGLYSFAICSFLILCTAAIRWIRISKHLNDATTQQSRNPLLETLINSSSGAVPVQAPPLTRDSGEAHSLSTDGGAGSEGPSTQPQTTQ